MLCAMEEAMRADRRVSVPRIDKPCPTTARRAANRIEHYTCTSSRYSYSSESISYALNRWPALMCYTRNGRLPIDNNAVGRAVERRAWPAQLPIRRGKFAANDGAEHSLTNRMRIKAVVMAITVSRGMATRIAR